METESLLSKSLSHTDSVVSLRVEVDYEKISGWSSHGVEVDHDIEVSLMAWR